MTEPLAFWNGAVVPHSKVSIPLNDAGFVMGATVTDLVRTVRQRLYRWDDHLARFASSCRATRIFPPIAEEEITRRAEELVSHNAAQLPGQQELILMLIATPGPLAYFAGQEPGPPTFLMYSYPLAYGRYRRFFIEGVKLVTPSIRQVPPECLDPRIKQRSRLLWWLADQEAQRIAAGSSALLLDQQGCITETATGNVLLVKNGTLLSPPREHILNGVSLQVVEELCDTLGMRFVETPLRLYDCLNADEMLHLSTPYCLAPVSQVNGAPLAFPGPIYGRLREAWSAALGLDYRGQILGV